MYIEKQTIIQRYLVCLIEKKNGPETAVEIICDEEFVVFFFLISVVGLWVLRPLLTGCTIPG
jgi:hypothetical protein